MTGAGESGPAQDAEEFAAFFARYSRGLGRLAYLLVGNAQAAEDLTADTFLAAWQQWERVQQIEYPLAYLRQIMTNLAAARYRHNARERRGLERLLGSADPDGQEPDNAAVVDVRTALQRLPGRRRACLVLRFGFDLSEREVAQILGISVGTVKSQTFRAAAQFRREIGDALTDTRTAVEVRGPAMSRPAAPGARARLTCP